MIVINEAECTGCGSCVEICHEHCMALVEGTIRINYEFCSTCTQCIAICPEQALSWDHVPAVAFDEARLPSPEQLDELFKERRSIRFYTAAKIDRPLLEKIISYGIYAPTHNFELRAIVVDDEKIIEEFDRIVLRFISRTYTALYRWQIVSSLAGMFRLSGEYLRAKPKIEAAMQKGSAFRHPAAMVFIVGDKRIPLSEASAQYALCNMIFYAQAKGIGSCPWGNGPTFLDRANAARKRLALQKHERILGALLLGYPEVKFANKMEGKTLSIQWNGGKNGLADTQ
jgi:nitroreductase/NAD-dependent dihydropyrimidine dehydrogenase PreA subunit